MRSKRAATLSAACVIVSAVLGAAASAAVVTGTSQTPSNWYRADAVAGVDGTGAANPLPADQTFLQTWVDVSGNGRNATQNLNVPRRPTFRTNVAGASANLPTVRFNLNQDAPVQSGQTSNTPDEFMTFPNVLANTANSKLTVFIVANDSRTTAEARGGIINTRVNSSSSTGFEIGYGANSTTTSYAHFGKTTVTTPAASTQTDTQEVDDFNLTVLTRDALVSSLSHYSDLGAGGNTVSWNGFLPSAIAATQLGTEGGIANLYFQGDLAEVIIYDENYLSAADQLAVINYLGNKYGITQAASATSLVVPEPTSIAALATGAALLRRRRRA